jgi:hypothetical protein
MTQLSAVNFKQKGGYVGLQKSFSIKSKTMLVSLVRARLKKENNSRISSISRNIGSSAHRRMQLECMCVAQVAYTNGNQYFLSQSAHCQFL